MGYHVEERQYEDCKKDIMALPEVTDVEGMECPCCGDRLEMVDDRHFPIEEYADDGNFERMELFYCSECGTFCEVTQVYEPTVRRVEFKQDVYDD